MRLRQRARQRLEAAQRKVLESRFDYDNATPDRMVQRSIAERDLGAALHRAENPDYLEYECAFQLALKPTHQGAFDLTTKREEVLISMVKKLARKNTPEEQKRQIRRWLNAPISEGDITVLEHVWRSMPLNGRPLIELLRDPAIREDEIGIALARLFGD